MTLFGSKTGGNASIDADRAPDAVNSDENLGRRGGGPYHAAARPLQRPCTAHATPFAGKVRQSLSGNSPAFSAGLCEIAMMPLTQVFSAGSH